MSNEAKEDKSDRNIWWEWFPTGFVTTLFILILVSNSFWNHTWTAHLVYFYFILFILIMVIDDTFYNVPPGGENHNPDYNALVSQRLAVFGLSTLILMPIIRGVFGIPL